MRMTMASLRARAEQVLSLIRSQSEALDRIAIVTYGWMITRLLQSFLEMLMGHDFFVITGDTGIHLLESSPRCRRVVHFLNSTSHLDGLSHF